MYPSVRWYTFVNVLAKGGGRGRLNPVSGRGDRAMGHGAIWVPHRTSRPCQPALTAGCSPSHLGEDWIGA